MPRWFAAFVPIVLYSQPSGDLKAESASLRTRLEASPRLPLRQSDFPLERRAGWTLDFASSVAAGADGLIYIFQRGPAADPVIVADRSGRIVRSWGKGLFEIPHSIRVDPEGNVWTVDSGNSKVHKFSRDGRLLLEIVVGEIPPGGSGMGGTTDIAFGPGGRLFIADGYRNARVLEYSGDGKRVRQWGKAGAGAGEFRLPHGIAIDAAGVVYVADRENRRIQRFTLEGKLLGEWGPYGKTFSLNASRPGELWAGVQPADVPNGSECWILKLDSASGRILGASPSAGHHSIALNAAGEPLTGARPDRILWFRQ